MAFCVNCGDLIKEGVEFCTNCGMATRKDTFTDSAQKATRRVVFDGEIKKCPNCGEVLKSFTSFCTACGLELRSIEAVDSVKELSNKIQKIEATKPRGHRRKSIQIREEIDKEITNLIISFPIPNTKEDIMEFMILASTNVDISKAWIPKVEQAYIKAKTIFETEPEFIQVERLYRECKKRIRWNSTKNIRDSFVCLSVIIGIPIMLFIVASAISSNLEKNRPEKNNNEETRLESIVSEANEAMKNREYKYALRIVESIEYKAFDHERERWWGVKKQSLIDEIIDEAKKSGVELVRPTEASTSEY